MKIQLKVQILWPPLCFPKYVHQIGVLAGAILAPEALYLTPLQQGLKFTI